MTIKRWNGTSYTDLTTLKRWNGTTWVDITLAKRWNGTTWVDIPLPGGGTPPLSLTISPGNAYGELNYSNPPYPSAQTVTTNSVTMNPAGGTGTPAYAWEYVSGSTGITPTTPYAASTQFSASLLRNRSVTATFRGRCVRGAETVSVNLTVTLAYYTGDI